jgi:drug/metabolite transporter (DMT)-like permease
MIAVLLGLVAALTNSGVALISKRLTTHYPARQLIGPIYLLNSLVLLPAAPFVTWIWTPPVLALHAVSVVLMIVGAITIWDLYDAGSASAAATSQALSPLPTTLAVAFLLPATFHPLQAVAAVIVVAGVVWMLNGSFEGHGKVSTIVHVLGSAVGTGLLTVVSRLLADQGVNVVETYVVRTFVAGLVFVILFPPRALDAKQMPRLLVRSVVVTAYFVSVILGASWGSPAVVQTLVATTPLWVLAVETWRARTHPPARGVAAACVVLAGVLITLAA